MEVHNAQAQLNEDGSLTITGSVHTNESIAATLGTPRMTFEVFGGEIRFTAQFAADREAIREVEKKLAPTAKKDEAKKKSKG